MKQELLTRDQFRTAVFERDNYVCVFCDKPAIDAHHILERRLWPDGGYYVNNGASVCQQHHILCEETTIPVDEVRIACHVTRPIIPPHLYDDQPYDKWGNPILPNGQRLKGDLFDDESVQKILKQGGFLDLFTHYVKYPRTYHLPWSPGMTDDDRMMPDVSVFDGQDVVVMEKLDGENTTMYQDYIHARSIDSGSHTSRNWIKAFHGQICGDIPWGWRVNVENVYAKHAIFYDNLETYAYGFAIWDDKNYILDWDATLEWFNLIGITACPVIYRGIFDKKAIETQFKHVCDDHTSEGYVVRLSKSFHYKEFRTNVAKYVRKGHIQEATHWFYGQKVVPNVLKKPS